MYTTDEFVEKVELYGELPSGRYTSEEVLDVAYDQLTSVVVPLIIALNEEYYVRSESQSVVAGQREYEIPYRALGRILRELKLVKDTRVIDLPRMEPELVFSSEQSEPESFYLEGFNVVLYPTPRTAEGSVSMSYFLTPSRPVLVANAGQITAIDRVTGEITASLPADWTLYDSFDIVTAKNGHDSKVMDLTATAVSTSAITFAAASIPASIVVGDYVTKAGYSPYFQCPDIAYRYLAQLTVNDLLQSMGSQAELQAGMAKAEQLKGALIQTLSKRVVGAPKQFTIDSFFLR